MKQLKLLPWPQEIHYDDGAFAIAGSVSVSTNVEAAGPAVIQLRERIARTLPAESKQESVGSIELTYAADLAAAESYRLSVTSEKVLIESATAAGWFYGVQTLFQLIEITSAGATLPAVRIQDAPRFTWRGLMLDVSRHYFPVEGILRLLDCMAMQKLNVLHWHLTDDQGWRVQSQRYPKLTEVGAYRRGADGKLTPGWEKENLPHLGTYGAFYTQDEVKQVVQHATALHIRVVPEVEMPGHALAALAGYPHLSCTGGSFETAVRTGVFEDVYCAGNETVFEFLQGVIDELLPLFPGEYFHVGGDECPKDRWKSCPKCQARVRENGISDENGLQSYFIDRMGRFLADRGRRLIGWDEILEGGLPTGASVMSWRGTEGGIAAAKAGSDVVMSPYTHCYLDYRQAAEGEPFAIGNPTVITTLEKTYGFNPVPDSLSTQEAKHILGIQGNVWTEYMPDMQHVEYMIWPRASAIAEIGWSGSGSGAYSDFARRVKANEVLLDAAGSRYRPCRT